MPSFHLPPSPRYLVALSGGADSRLLLELTVRAVLARGQAVEATVMAAHLHHGIRGAEADRDEAFCRTVCEALGVPLVVEHADIPTLSAKTGQSEETVARAARYDFFLRTMTAHDIPTLLTAHNADDRLETVLHHLLRGSGTRGMGGIPPTRPLSPTDASAIAPSGTDTQTDALAPPMPLTVARPLLDWTKRDILAACRDRGLAYVTDRTNLEDGCTRNRLRHTVIPALEAVAGEDRPQRAVARLAQAAREDDEALTAIACARYRVVCAESRPAGLPTAALTAERPAIAKRMILCAYADFYGRRTATSTILSPSVPAAHTLSAYHLEQLLTLCRDGRSGQVSDQLPGGVCAVIRDGRLVFSPPSKTALARHGDSHDTASHGAASHRVASHDVASEVAVPLPRPLYEGDTVWDTGDGAKAAVLIRIESLPAEQSGAHTPPPPGYAVWASALFPADRLALPLWARPRQSGDTIHTHGMNKKLKKLLCDKHIPLHLRDRLPLICQADHTPLWFPSVAFCDGYAAPDTGMALRVTVYLPYPSSERTKP